MTIEITPEERVERARLLSRLAEIKTLFPESTQHDAAPLRLAIMVMAQYINDEEIVQALLALCPTLVFEEVR